MAISGAAQGCQAEEDRNIRACQRSDEKGRDHDSAEHLKGGDDAAGAAGVHRTDFRQKHGQG